ncbi:hypothetical protein P692DRAFT_20907963 [Suillus brevipes Sb2]|nr:hypothetical protein P692DRAFT_20907963 [Suillus brevipes Sb2]
MFQASQLPCTSSLGMSPKLHVGLGQSLVLCFTIANSLLLTSPGAARRISSLLGNSLSFSNMFLSQIIEEVSGPSIRTREASLQCRAYQCFSALGTSILTDSLQSSLLQSVLTVFVGPDCNASLNCIYLRQSNFSLADVRWLCIWTYYTPNI